MCHINILYVYVFNITSSLINIHVIKHINGCDAEEQYSHLPVRVGSSAPSRVEQS